VRYIRLWKISLPMDIPLLKMFRLDKVLILVQQGLILQRLVHRLKTRDL